MTAVLPNVSTRHLVVREALSLAAEKNRDELAKLQKELAEVEAQIDLMKGRGKRYETLALLRATATCAELKKKIEKVKAKSSANLCSRFESISARYHDAIQHASLTSNRMVTSSLHSTSRQLRRGNVVLMSPENAEECLRQTMRAELGLQETPLLLTPGDVCDECGVQMNVVSNDSMLSCPQCHKLRVLPNTMTTSALHGGDVEISNAITKHRLPEWIDMAGAEEYSEPPEDMSMEVARFIAQHKMTGLEEFKDYILEERGKRGAFRSVSDAVARLPLIPDLRTRLKIVNSNLARIALKGLVTSGHTKFRKFYERSSKIAAIVSGFWPPRMNSQQKETLRLLYTTAAPYYEKRRKPKQTYWPGGFPFFLRCACVLLGWDEFAPQFPIPAGSREGGSRDSLRAEIWNELGWEVVPYTGRPSPMRLPDGSEWCGDLDEGAEDEDEEGGGAAQMDDGEAANTKARRAVAKAVRKDVESKIQVKKRRRVDFDLECA